jgi:hypothetical protein
LTGGMRLGKRVQHRRIGRPGHDHRPAAGRKSRLMRIKPRAGVAPTSGRGAPAAR